MEQEEMDIFQPCFGSVSLAPHSQCPRSQSQCGEKKGEKGLTLFRNERVTISTVLRFSIPDFRLHAAKPA
ncbi:hypothetical protein SETIT_2G364800v2 [Setaria italica]|uniref:Uncharacterized protein n=1 Tax=Setaria italica TaxID=4555 RepID=A0A368Q6N2_SETIT|nr:hypothetical protein SETIT_2G364800v2 [Setaria italica]